MIIRFLSFVVILSILWVRHVIIYSSRVLLSSGHCFSYIHSLTLHSSYLLLLNMDIPIGMACVICIVDTTFSLSCPLLYLYHSTFQLLVFFVRCIFITVHCSCYILLLYAVYLYQKHYMFSLVICILYHFALQRSYKSFFVVETSNTLMKWS